MVLNFQKFNIKKNYTMKGEFYMKKFTKLVATTLAFVMFATTVLPTHVFASGISPAVQPISSNTSIVYIEDDNGNIIPIEITETIYGYDNEGISPNALTPEVDVGTTRTYSVKISNELMGLPSVAGGAITYAAKKAAVKATSKAIAAKLATGFAPGINFVSWALGAAAWANAVTGKAGIKITVKLKYTSTYIHKEGYYLYGWSPTSLSISRY